LIFYIYLYGIYGRFRLCLPTFVMKFNLENALQSNRDNTHTTLIFNVPDLKLLITDPDPQIENQEFRIQILN